MRRLHAILIIAAALALGACAQRPQTYYIIDPQTGQPVPVVAQAPASQLQYPQQPGYPPQQTYAQRPAPQAYPAQTYAQQTYAQQPSAQQTYAAAPPASQSRALYSTSPAYAQQNYGQPSYAPPQPQKPATQERGLFSSRSSAPAATAQRSYAAAPQTGGPYVASPYNAYASAPSNYEPAYTLDSGDKLRIVVFGQDGISNSYLVDASGNVNLPLIGVVPARGLSTQQLSRMITDKLKQGYVREPHVSVEVEAYRPFFILGEVTAPGQYAYVANMTAETAIAIAGGFAPRANKKTVELTRNSGGQQIKGEIPLNYQLRPGDTIVVKERWF